MPAGPRRLAVARCVALILTIVPQASYTFSKSIDDTSAVLGGLPANAGVILQTLPQNPFNPEADKGPSTFDVTHVFSLSLIQSLPFDRVGFLQPLGRRITSGWQFLNITSITSGPPFTVYFGIQQTGVGAGGTDRPDLVKMPVFSTSRTIREDYFGLGADNSSFLSIPIDVPGGTGPNDGRFGIAGAQHVSRTGLPRFRHGTDLRTHLSVVAEKASLESWSSERNFSTFSILSILDCLPTPCSARNPESSATPRALRGRFSSH